MSDKAIPNNPSKAEKDDEPIKSVLKVSEEEGPKPSQVSEEEVLKSVQNRFKADNRSEDTSLEDKEFIKYLRFRKRAKEIGLDDQQPSVINNNYYDGGIHINDSNVENYGDVVGNNKTTTNTGGFSGEVRSKAPNDEENVQSIEAVFDRCEDIKQRCFIITLAVLNGCNYRIVLESSLQLQSILQSQVEIEQKTIPSNLDQILNGKKRSQWLEEISACLTDDYEITEYGKSRIKTVIFKDEEAPISILFHVWNEYNTYAEAVLKWLCELGAHPTFEVRLRAAAVVGQLAVFEFRPVREKILLPWAKSDKKNIQTLAALALARVAYDEDEEVAQQALNLLHHWSGLQNSTRLNWTAIAAYGSYVGILYPQQSLENLKIIAQSGDDELFPDVAQAVVNLFEAGQQNSNLYLYVLNALKKWVEESQKKFIHQLGLMIFWVLMNESWTIQNGVRQPTLMWLAKQNQEFEDLISFLIRNALNLEFSRSLILPEILNWLKFIDQYQPLYKTLARIIFALARPGRERERIFIYLGRWSRESNTAFQILNLVKQHT